MRLAWPLLAWAHVALAHNACEECAQLLCFVILGVSGLVDMVIFIAVIAQQCGVRLAKRVEQLETFLSTKATLCCPVVDGCDCVVEHSLGEGRFA